MLTLWMLESPLSLQWSLPRGPLGAPGLLMSCSEVSWECTACSQLPLPEQLAGQEG